jgi:hypothetical protein
MRRIAAAAVAIGVLVSACGDGGSPDSTKFKQTWSKSYDETTCTDWLDLMDNHQRFVAAGDQLIVLRKRDGNGELPPDDMIGAFALSMSDICRAPAGDLARSILEIGPLVYIAFPEQFKP